MDKGHLSSYAACHTYVATATFNAIMEDGKTAKKELLRPRKICAK